MSSPEIERDEQGRAARLVFRRSNPQHGEASDSGVTPHGDAQDGILRCVCGNPRATRGRFCSRRCKDRAYNLAHPVARQRSLPLDPEPQPVIPTRDQRVPEGERPKLKRMTRLIAERFKANGGTALASELHAMFPGARSVRTRISEFGRWLAWDRRKLTSAPVRGFVGDWRYWIEGL